MHERLEHIALYRWWRRSIVSQVNHQAVMGRIVEDSRRGFVAVESGSGGDFFGGLLLSSFPMPREEFVKAVLWDVGDPGEDVGEPGERIKVVEPGRAE